MELLSASVIDTSALHLGGRAQRVRLVSNGSGLIDAAALRADDLVLRQAGSGTATAYARYSADVRSSGPGTVTVYGKPKCRTRATGGGIACGVPVPTPASPG